MTREKDPKYNLKLKYKKRLELGLILSLLLLIIFMQGFKKIDRSKKETKKQIQTFVVEDIPQTKQEKSQKAPAKPTMPVASEDEDLPDDATLDLDDWSMVEDDEELPPPPEEEGGLDLSMPTYTPYEERPQPLEPILNNLDYPPMAVRAQVEGTVSVRAYIDENGKVLKVMVLEGEGIEILNEAAKKAVMKTPWKPAQQRDQPVAVWVAIPVSFNLK